MCRLVNGWILLSFLFFFRFRFFIFSLYFALCFAKNVSLSRHNVRAYCVCICVCEIFRYIVREVTVVYRSTQCNTFVKGMCSHCFIAVLQLQENIIIKKKSLQRDTAACSNTSDKAHKCISYFSTFYAWMLLQTRSSIEKNKKKMKFFRFRVEKTEKKCREISFVLNESKQQLKILSFLVVCEHCVLDDNYQSIIGWKQVDFTEIKLPTKGKAIQFLFILCFGEEEANSVFKWKNKMSWNEKHFEE